jgi:hypothetical protein
MGLIDWVQANPELTVASGMVVYVEVRLGQRGAVSIVKRTTTRVVRNGARRVFQWVFKNDDTK